MLWLFCCLAPLTNSWAREALQLGVPAYRELGTVRAEFAPLVQSLTRALERPVELQVLPPLVLIEAYAAGRIDLLLAGTQLHRQLRQRLPMPAPIATLRREYRGQPLTLLAAVLLARAEMPAVEDFRQLARYRLAIAESIAPEGGRELTRQLAARGLPPVPASQISWARSHEEAVRLLQQRQVDIALVRTGILESMLDAGDLAATELVALGARQTAGFPLVHSTPPVPEWAALPAPATDPVVCRQLAQILLALSVDSGQSSTGSPPIVGFDPPADYAETAIAAPATVTPDSRWNSIAAALVGLSIGLAGLLVYRHRSRQRLAETQARADRLRKLLDALPVGVWHRRTDGGVDFVNARIRDVMSTSLRLPQAEYAALFPEPVAEQLEAADAETCRHGTAHHRRIRLATPDGTLRELELIQVRTLDRDRHVDGVLSIAIPREESDTLNADSLLIRYEQLLARLSTDMMGVDSKSLDAAINRALAALGEAAAADRAYMFLINAAETHADNTHEWCAPGVAAELSNQQDLNMARDYPWLLDSLRQGRTVVVEDVAALPTRAANERALFEGQHIKSLLIVPMLAGTRLAGFIGLDDIHAPRQWQAAEQSLLRVVGEVLVHALLRMRAERSLDEVAAYQRALLGALPDLLFVFDREGHYLDVHPRGHGQLLSEAALSRHISEVLPIEIADKTCTALSRIFAGSPIERFDYSLRLGERDCSFAAELVRLDAGRALAICRDITDRHRAEIALADSEARHRALVEHSQSLIFQLDAEERFSFVSRSARLLLGESPPTLIGRSLRELIARDDHDALRSYLQRLTAAMEEGIADHRLDEGLELRFLQADGRRRWLHLVMTRISSGGRITVVGNAVDIQGRVEARQQLVELAGQLQAVIDGVPSLIFVKDADGRYRIANRSCAAVFGRSPAEMIGLTDFELLDDPALASLYRSHDQKAIEDDQPVYIEREPVPHVDGRLLWCQTIKTRWNMPGDSRTGVLGVSTDISVRVHAEEQLRRESELTALLVRLALSYIDLPVRQLDDTIRASIAELGAFIGAARVSMLRRTISGSLDNIAEWCAPGIHPIGPDIGPATGELGERLARGEIVELPDADERNTVPDRRLAALAIPLMRGREYLGLLGFDWHRDGQRRTPGEVQLLAVFAQMLVNAHVHAEVATALAQQRRRLELVIEGTGAGTWIWWPKTGALEINAQWAAILGYTVAELEPVDFQSWRRLTREDDLAVAEAALAAHAAGQTPVYEARIRMRHKGGHWVWVLSCGRIVERDAEGDVLIYAGTHQDVTAAVLAAERQRLAASVFTHSHEGILITDPEARIVEVNDAFTRITGYQRDEVIGRNPGLLKSGRHGPEFYRTLWSALKEHGHWAGEIWNRRRNGEFYAEFLTISSVRDDAGELLNHVALFSDITVQKQHQQRLERIAHYDTLTGLPNRVLLADRLRQAMAQARRRKQQVAVAFIDLDGFKTINDTHGHETGDQFLREVGLRMRRSLREWDTVSRLGGDEFVAVMIDLPDRTALKRLLQRLVEVLNTPIQIGDQLLPLSASLGVSFYPQSEELDAEQLLRQADQAMYHAKRAGKRQLCYFDAALDESHRHRIDSLNQLREALARGELLLHYQPITDLGSGCIDTVEALLRWNHPERGLLVPADFLPLIEGDELILRLGEWVLDQALADQRQWQTRHPGLGVSINVAALQLLRHGFVELLASRLQANPADLPGRLTLEVVETSVLDDLGHATRVIRACRKLGAAVTLDDFGTGYSSLSYLKHLPLTGMKIDQSFVRDMLVDPEDLAIIDGILGLGRAFGLEVVAEGVETLAQAEVLFRLGCTRQQGYALARPMPISELSEWLLCWQPDVRWRDWQPLRRGLLPLYFAEAEVRGSIADTLARSGLQSTDAAAPDTTRCRFGRWLAQLSQVEVPSSWREPLQQCHDSLHEFSRLLLQQAPDTDEQARIRDALEQVGAELCQRLRRGESLLAATIELPPLPAPLPDSGC